MKITIAGLWYINHLHRLFVKQTTFCCHIIHIVERGTRNNIDNMKVEVENGS